MSFGALSTDCNGEPLILFHFACIISYKIKSKGSGQFELDFPAGTKSGCAKILQFIKELADYENMLDEVVATEYMLEEWLFEKKSAEVIFAVADGCDVGFCLVLPKFFHLLGSFRHLSGRPVCETGIPKFWDTEKPF